MTARTSGCTDYYAETEEEAFELGRASVAAFNIEPVQAPTDVREPVFSADDILGLITPDNKMYIHQVNMSLYIIIALNCVHTTLHF